jgi:hypothetical protein
LGLAALSERNISEMVEDGGGPDVDVTESWTASLTIDPAGGSVNAPMKLSETAGNCTPGTGMSNETVSGFNGTLA